MAGPDRRPGVQRVRRGDQDRFRPGVAEHRIHVGERPA
jgi:hypothetical protein